MTGARFQAREPNVTTRIALMICSLEFPPGVRRLGRSEQIFLTRMTLQHMLR